MLHALGWGCTSGLLNSLRSKITLNPKWKLFFLANLSQPLNYVEPWVHQYYSIFMIINIFLNIKQICRNSIRDAFSF